MAKKTASTAQKIRTYLKRCKNPMTAGEIARGTKSRLKTVRNNLGTMQYTATDDSTGVWAYEDKRQCKVTGNIATTYSL